MSNNKKKSRIKTKKNSQKSLLIKLNLKETQKEIVLKYFDAKKIIYNIFLGKHRMIQDIFQARNGALYDDIKNQHLLIDYYYNGGEIQKKKDELYKKQLDSKLLESKALTVEEKNKHRKAAEKAKEEARSLIDIKTKKRSHWKQQIYLKPPLPLTELKKISGRNLYDKQLVSFNQEMKYEVMNKQLTILKKEWVGADSSVYPHYYDFNYFSSHHLQEIIKDLATAFSNMLNKIKKGERASINFKKHDEVDKLSAYFVDSNIKNKESNVIDLNREIIKKIKQVSTNKGIIEFTNEIGKINFNWDNKILPEVLKEKFICAKYIKCGSPEHTGDGVTCKKCNHKNKKSDKFICSKNIKKCSSTEHKGDKITCKVCDYKSIRNLTNEINSFRLKNDNKHWYLSVAYNYDIFPIKRIFKSVGIDFGVAQSITLSDPDVDIHKYSIHHQTKLKRLIRRKDEINIRLSKALFRKSSEDEDSQNVKKIKRELRIQHRKIKNLRKSFNRHVADDITKNYTVIFIEDIQTKNLTKSSKGNAEVIGSNVKAKSGLNRAILEIGWYQLKTFIVHKAKERSCVVIFVPPKDTSIICSKCGYKNKENRKSQSEFLCMECGFKEHADINAAINIEIRGLLEYYKNNKNNFGLINYRDGNSWIKDIKSKRGLIMSESALK